MKSPSPSQVHTLQRLIIAVGGLLILLAQCTSKQNPQAQLTASLDSLMFAEFPGGQPGGAMMIAKDGKVLYSKASGIADLKSQTPIDSKTLFNLGSISKTFVASAILLLEKEGKLSVDDSIARYFSGFKHPEIAQLVRIRHLLMHSSGLPDNRAVGADTVFYLTAKDEENFYPLTQCDSLVFEPGTRFEYSNPAYNGLALIVEKVSGMKWQQFVTERILRPSGMTLSTITDGPHPEANVAHAYYSSNGSWVEDDYGEEPTFPAAGNGGVWSSLDELLLYENALRSGVFMDTASLTAARQSKNPWDARGDSPLNDRAWAVGWSWFVSEEKDGVHWVGHSGTQGGFYCNYLVVPKKNLLFIVLANRPFDRAAFTRKVMQKLQRLEWLDQPKS